MSIHVTRLWASSETTTMVQFRTDTDHLVWIHTNVGWVPITNAPDNNEYDAALFAEEIAKGYGLTELSQEQARYFAGWEDEA